VKKGKNQSMNGTGLYICGTAIIQLLTDTGKHTAIIPGCFVAHAMLFGEQRQTMFPVCPMENFERGLV